MSLKNRKIDICIATFKRPELLARLLSSILEQKSLPEQKNLQIIVIDNDAHETARKVVESFVLNCIYKIVYDIEPIQNIALTRNRALKYTKGDYVIFVDDDEYVSELWIEKHVQCAVEFKADVVFGPVVPILPDSAKSWVHRGGFFKRIRYRNGSKRDRGATNNTLVRAEILNEIDNPFDQEFGLTGGSDTKLFYSLYKKGYKLVWSDKAEVYEHVSVDRMTIRWLSLRAFRGGQVFIRVFFPDMPIYKTIFWCFLRMVVLCFSMISIPFLWIFGRHLGMKALQKTCGYLGQMTTIMGFIQYKEYKNE